MFKIKLLIVLSAFLIVNSPAQDVKSLTNDFGSSLLIDVFRNSDNSYTLFYNFTVSENKNRIRFLIDNYESQTQNNSKDVCPSVLSNQTGAKIIPIGKDLYVAAWIDFRKDKAGDIYLQLLDKNGVVWDSSAVPVCVIQGKQDNISLTSDINGNIYISWIDYRFDSFGDIYIQKFDFLGNEKWKKNGVRITDLSGVEKNVSLIADNNDCVYLSYTDYANLNSQIYIQKLDKNGNKLFGKYGKFISSPNSVSDYSALFFHDDLGLTIFWTSTDSVKMIHAQRIGLNGMEKWTEFGEDISNIKKDQLNPKYYYYDNSFFILFTIADAGKNKIYLQRMTENGILEYSSSGYQVGSLTSENIKIDLIPYQNNYLVAYLDKADFSNFCKLYGQLVSEDGIVLWKEVGNILTSSDLDTDSFMKLFIKNRNFYFYFDRYFGSVKNVFSTKITDNFNKYNSEVFSVSNFEVSFSNRKARLWWVINGQGENIEFIIERKLSSEANWTQIHKYSISSDNSQRFQSYEDSDLKGKKVSYRIKYKSSGREYKYTDIRTFDVPDSPEVDVLLQNNPNPFNGSTKISFKLNSPSRVKLSIFNSRAELITELIRDNFSAGTHEVVFTPAEDLASGIYFYKLETSEFVEVKKMVYTK